MKYDYGDINQNQIEEINQEHSNKKYLPDVHLPENIDGYIFTRRCISGLEIIVLAVPTKAIREVLGKIKEFQKHPLTIVHVSKGIEPAILNASFRNDRRGTPIQLI